MRHYMDVIPQGLIFLESDMTITGWNACMEAWTSLSRQDILGKNLLECFPYLEEPRYKNRLKMVLEQGAPVVFSAQLHRFFIDCQDGRGKQRIQNTTISPIRKQNGEYQALVCIDDVTETVERVAQYRATRDQALALANMKTNFTANVSHELRTPMNGILGMAELLLYDSLPPESEERVQNILSCGRSLLNVLNDILDFSKIEAGRLAIKPYDFDLQSEIQQTLRLFRRQAIDKALRLMVDIDSDVPRYLHGDAARLRQILTNLLGNALKFTSEGGVTLKVSADGKDQYRFAVIDTGIGIPKEKLEQIFDSYTQVDDSHTRSYGGTGLGLAISRQLAQQMGGDLLVESESGKGSQFVVCIPLTEGVTSQSEAGESKMMQAEGLNLKILLADDNMMNLVLAESFLGKLGCECQTAENGKEAVELFQKDTFDVVLIDIQMPIMDGMQATAEIREFEAGRHRTPIIALTAHATEGWRERCLEANMDDYLTKPLSMEKLYKCLSFFALGSDTTAMPQAV